MTWSYPNGGCRYLLRLQQLVKVIEGAPHTAAIVRLPVTDLHYQPVKVVNSWLFTVRARVLP